MSIHYVLFTYEAPAKTEEEKESKIEFKASLEDVDNQSFMKKLHKTDTYEIKVEAKSIPTAILQAREMIEELANDLNLTLTNHAYQASTRKVSQFGEKRG